MKFDRRTLLKLLLASAVAEAVDVEKLLWVPKPIITVPELPVIRFKGIPLVYDRLVNRGAMIAEAWENYVKSVPPQSDFEREYRILTQNGNKKRLIRVRDHS